MVNNLTKKLSKVVNKETLEKNRKAIKAYSYYKESTDLIDRMNTALGKKQHFHSTAGSTVNFEVNQNGVKSTTQKI